MEHGIEDLVDKSKIDIVVQRQVTLAQVPAVFSQQSCAADIYRPVGGLTG